MDQRYTDPPSLFKQLRMVPSLQVSNPRRTTYPSVSEEFSRDSGKTTAQGATKLSGTIKWDSRSVLHGLTLPVLQLLKRYPSISGFSFAADGHFITINGFPLTVTG